MAILPVEKCLGKLPTWAQAYIAELERERNEAVRTLREHTDRQTPSAFWMESIACTGEKERGQSFHRQYFDTHRVVCCHRGVELVIQVSDGDPQHYPGIELTISDPSRMMNPVCVWPCSNGKIVLMAKRDMPG